MAETAMLRCIQKEPLPRVALRMSNFDHSIDDGLAEAISDGQHAAEYAGWDFFALVYVVEGAYVADVHSYGLHVGFKTASTLEALMCEVSDEWGWD